MHMLVLYTAVICAKSAQPLTLCLGFYFEGDIGLCEINLAVRAAFTCNEGCGFIREPREGAASSFFHNIQLNPHPPPPHPCIITAGENKCCDIRLFNPLSSEKCILSRSNLPSYCPSLFLEQCCTSSTAVIIYWTEMIYILPIHTSISVHLVPGHKLQHVPNQPLEVLHSARSGSQVLDLFAFISVPTNSCKMGK